MWIWTAFLFDDLSFYGPNRLNSRRSMTVWELQARRDRMYFMSILTARGPEALQEEILSSLAHQSDRPRLDVEVARRGRATNVDAGRELRLAFLQFSDSPVEPSNRNGPAQRPGSPGPVAGGPQSLQPRHSLFGNRLDPSRTARGANSWPVPCLPK